jgi:hypothetical protein
LYDDITDRKNRVILRLLAIAMWLTASLSAHAEGAFAHAPAEAEPAASACIAAPSGDPDAHCPSVCLATSGLSLQSVSVLPVPQSGGADTHVATIPTSFVPTPADLPPSRAGPTFQQLPPAHLRDLSGIRLLI